MKRKPTKAQRWQRKRWNTKGHIVAIKNRLNKINKLDILTTQEMLLVRTSVAYLTHMLFNWNERNNASKHKYISTK